jgi:hypothetical protein
MAPLCLSGCWITIEMSTYKEGLHEKKTPHRFEKEVTKKAKSAAVRFSWLCFFFIFRKK